MHLKGVRGGGGVERADENGGSFWHLCGSKVQCGRNTISSGRTRSVREDGLGQALRLVILSCGYGHISCCWVAAQ